MSWSGKMLSLQNTGDLRRVSGGSSTIAKRSLSSSLSSASSSCSSTSSSSASSTCSPAAMFIPSSMLMMSGDDAMRQALKREQLQLHVGSSGEHGGMTVFQIDGGDSAFPFPFAPQFDQNPSASSAMALSSLLMGSSSAALASPPSSSSFSYSAAQPEDLLLLSSLRPSAMPNAGGGGGTTMPPNSMLLQGPLYLSSAGQSPSSSTTGSSSSSAESSPIQLHHGQLSHNIVVVPQQHQCFGDPSSMPTPMEQQQHQQPQLTELGCCAAINPLISSSGVGLIKAEQQPSLITTTTDNKPPAPISPTGGSRTLSGSLPSGTNQLGRTYSPGLPLSMAERQKIVELYQDGWKICDISKYLCVTHSCVSKILQRFRSTGSVRPKDAKEGRQESPLVAAIRDYRLRLGIVRQSDIREQLIRDGLCRPDNVPSRSSINHILRTKLNGLCVFGGGARKCSTSSTSSKTNIAESC